ncbi:MAG: mechanosensitive ion channel family protein [Vicinamibacterales bacterium]
MPSAFEQLPWLSPLLGSMLTMAGAYLAGRLLNVVIVSRIARLAKRTPGEWDDILVGELTSRVPLWSTLVGIWLSLGYWPITDRWLLLVSGAIAVAAFASVTFALAAVATRLVAVYGSRAVPGVPVSGLTQNIVRLIVIVFGLLVMLNQFGIEIRPMLAALGVGGLAVALALQDPLSNLFAGLFISMAGQVRIGDHVRLDSGIEGRIVDFNWRSTWLEMPSGSIAVVPNAKLSQAVVTNFNLPTPEVSVPIEIVVDRRSDAAQVELVAMDVARGVLHEVEGAVSDFEPVVHFHTFADTVLRGTVVLRARALADLSGVRHAFIMRLQARLREAGIALPAAVPPAPAAPPGPPPSH